MNPDKMEQWLEEHQRTWIFFLCVTLISILAIMGNGVKTEIVPLIRELKIMDIKISEDVMNLKNEFKNHRHKDHPEDGVYIRKIDDKS